MMMKKMPPSPTGVASAHLFDLEEMPLNYSRGIAAFPEAKLSGYFERQAWMRTLTRHLTLRGPLLEYRHSEEEEVEWIVDLRETNVVPGKRAKEFRIQKDGESIALFAPDKATFCKWFSEMKRVSDSVESFYRIGLCVGHFKDCEMFLGRERLIDTSVCIHKIKKGDVLRDALLGERDASVIRATQHKNIIEIVDVFETSNWFYLVTEASYGRRLSQIRILPKQHKAILKQLLQALAHLHLNGCIHGNMSTDVVLMSGSTVKLLAYGYATNRDTMTTDMSCANDMFCVGGIMKELGIECEMTNRLLSQDAGKRMTAEECLKDNWFYSLEEVNMTTENGGLISIGVDSEKAYRAVDVVDEKSGNSPTHVDVSGVEEREAGGSKAAR